MSMHEIEDVIEESIKLLDSANVQDLNLRSVAFSLYNFQAQFDTGITILRLKDILVKCNYLYILPLSSLSDIDLSSLPEGGYKREQEVVIEAGSPAWSEFVRKGLISGENAIPPQDLDPYMLALKIMEHAINDGKPTLAAAWYKDIFLANEFEQIEDVEAVRNNEYIIKIRKLAKEHDLMNVEAFRFENDMVDELYGDKSLINWWIFKED